MSYSLIPSVISRILHFLPHKSVPAPSPGGQILEDRDGVGGPEIQFKTVNGSVHIRKGK